MPPLRHALSCAESKTLGAAVPHLHLHRLVCYLSRLGRLVFFVLTSAAITFGVDLILRLPVWKHVSSDPQWKRASYIDHRD